MSEKQDLSAYDELIEDVVREAEDDEIQASDPKAEPTLEEAINSEVDEFVNSVVEEAQMPVSNDSHKTDEPVGQGDKPEPIKRTLADFPDADYKVISYNDKSDQKAFYLYSILGRYPIFPILLLVVEAGLSVWFAFNNNRQDLLTFSGFYFALFLLADVGFFALRIHTIVKKIGQKDEHALDTVRVEAAFFQDYLVLIKYGFDIRMDYNQLEHYGRMGDRIYLYFDNHKALLLHVDDFDKKTFAQVDALLKKVVHENKLARSLKKQK